MDATLKKIQGILLENFPEIGDLEISAETRLGEIPGWDSMVAVNLQMFLDESFHVVVILDLLNEETTLADLVAYIENPDAMARAAARQA
jgi:acyl carrier protein